MDDENIKICKWCIYNGNIYATERCIRIDIADMMNPFFILGTNLALIICNQKKFAI